MSLALTACLAAPALAHDTGVQHEHGMRLSQSEVREVQRQLDKAGYPIASADGVMGPKTETAIRNFQRDKGLNATGELNDETMKALRSSDDSATSGAGAR
jgi:peptidoglycan hydrolase-like protein with peptidoglycan-binding domain